MTIALIKPKYKKGPFRGLSNQAAFQRFDRRINEALAEIIVGKGMTVKVSPTGDAFESWEKMVYAEKKGAHLLIYPEFDLDLQITRTWTRESTPCIGLFCAAQQKEFLESRVDLTGSAYLRADEPQAQERMWLKPIDVRNISETVPKRSIGTVLERSPIQQRLAALNPGGANPTYQSNTPLDIAEENAMLRCLERFYVELMAQLDGYVSRGEMQALRKQAEEIKARKGY